MAEEEQQLPKRKGRGKIIVLMVVALMMAAGGFFAISMKTAHSKDPLPKVELSDKETELEEFLTNTANPGVYVRAKIVVRLRKDFSEETLKANMGDLRDAVVLTLNGTAPSDVTDAAKRSELKHRLADAMNAALKEVDKDGKKFTPASPKDDWNSVTGPVLKVRFNALATQ
jgi:flagellar basal body-associated protein FliL